MRKSLEARVGGQRIRDGELSTIRRRIRVSYTCPSFWSGFAQSFDLFGLLNRDNADEVKRVLNEIRTRRTNTAGFEADAKALRGDWNRVGLDMRAAMARFESEDAYRLSKDKAMQ